MEVPLVRNDGIPSPSIEKDGVTQLGRMGYPLQEGWGIPFEKDGVPLARWDASSPPQDVNRQTPVKTVLSEIPSE